MVFSWIFLNPIWVFTSQGLAQMYLLKWQICLHLFLIPCTTTVTCGRLALPHPARGIAHPALQVISCSLQVGPSPPYTFQVCPPTSSLSWHVQFSETFSDCPTRKDPLTTLLSITQTRVIPLTCFLFLSTFVPVWLTVGCLCIFCRLP